MIAPIVITIGSPDTFPEHSVESVLALAAVALYNFIVQTKHVNNISNIRELHFCD